MNIRCFSNDQDVFVNLECVSGFSFKYAHLGDKSVLLPVQCSIFSYKGIAMPIKNVLNTLHLTMRRPD